MGLMDKLREQDGAFKDVEAAAASGERQPLPAGKYQFRVLEPANTGLVHEDTDGAVRARVSLEVEAAADDELIGRRTSKSWTLLTADGELNEMGVEYLKKDLRTMGVEREDYGLSEVETVMADILGVIVSAGLVLNEKNGTKYENVYINSLVAAQADNF